jgi:hypothetical protein
VHRSFFITKHRQQTFAVQLNLFLLMYLLLVHRSFFTTKHRQHKLLQFNWIFFCWCILLMTALKVLMIQNGLQKGDSVLIWTQEVLPWQWWKPLESATNVGNTRMNQAPCCALPGFRMSVKCWAFFCWKSGPGKCHYVNQSTIFM